MIVVKRRQLETSTRVWCSDSTQDWHEHCCDYVKRFICSSESHGRTDSGATSPRPNALLARLNEFSYGSGSVAEPPGESVENLTMVDHFQKVLNKKEIHKC